MNISSNDRLGLQSDIHCRPGAYHIHPSPYSQRVLLEPLRLIRRNTQSLPTSHQYGVYDGEQILRVEGYLIEDSAPTAVSGNAGRNSEEDVVGGSRKDKLVRIKYVILMVLLIVSILAVSIAVPVSLKRQRVSRTVEIPVTRYEKFKSILLSVSNESTFLNATSPQSRALHWIVHEDAANVSETDEKWIRQRYIMSVFYYSTTTQNSTWRDQCEFLTPKHECEWHNASNTSGRINCGATCDDMYRKEITSIFLSTNNLFGTLPMELGYVTSLKNIILARNKIGGSIPYSWINCRQLENLELRFNQLTGRLPFWFAELTALRSIVLSGNRFMGAIPSIDLSTSIRNFDLTQNLLSGPLPSLPESLVYLDLSENELSGSIPTSISALSNLRTMILHKNRLNGTIPSAVEKLSSLLTFSMIENQISGTIPSMLGKLSNLVVLGLGSNLLTGPLDGIEELSTLQGLSIDNNYFHGTIPKELGRLTNMVALTMEKNQFTGTIPQEIGFLTRMRFLSFGDNLITGPIPDSLTNLTRLSYLSIGNSYLNGTLEPLCSSLNATDHDFYIAADCFNELTCPSKCCKYCCDDPDQTKYCNLGYVYLDPLVIAYSFAISLDGEFDW